MIAKPNWDIFKAKFNGSETANFEYFCYLLFCIEFKQPYGIFRYKNQHGLESNPIEIDGKGIGFQSKFYDKSLADKKPDLLKMLDTIHEKYPTLTELKLYTNQNWGQGKDGNDSKPKQDIEEKAKSYNININWRTDESYFQSLDVSVINKDIASHFFSIESIYDTVREKQKSTQRILNNIRAKIQFDSNTIELDRSSVLNDLKNTLKTNQILILSGVGGVGKTAVIKNLFEDIQENAPFYLFKANEFNKSDVNELFGKYSIENFIDIHKVYKEKIVVIDSAEKLLDFDSSVFKEFLDSFIKNHWKIIFTARNSYLEDLNYQFIDRLKIQPFNINIENLTNKELINISEKHKFNLPTDFKLEELIKNTFYLNEYLLFYKEDEQIDYQQFKQKVWKQNIKTPDSEKCFLELAFKRANEGIFYINIDCAVNSLEELRRDEILGYENSAYFISHDIYEEWALERIINREFLNRNNDKSFFENIGSSLPVRRAFRSWVSGKLLLNDTYIKSFIDDIINSRDLESFWKDEIFISILLSDYSDTFFENFDKELKENDFKLLRRLSFLLRLACKEVDNSLLEQYKLNSVQKFEMFQFFNMPKGNGWKSFITFVFNSIDNICVQNINFILPVIYEWNGKYKNGKTTRFASLIALNYYESLNDNNDKLIKTIVYGADEIKNELESIFIKVIESKYRNSRDPYYYLCKQLLVQMEFSNVSKILPKYILQIADLLWYNPQIRKQNSCARFDYSTEEVFGLADGHDFKYFPASAWQTPIYWCLKSEQNLTIKFILNFTNRAIESFIKSNKNIKKIKLSIDGQEVVQIHNSSLWSMYRGMGSYPCLLQSIHMALEKYLLDIAHNLEQESLEILLSYLLLNAKSSSVTGVVASIVVAYPEKTFNIALSLFKVQKFLECDFTRSTQEHISHFDSAYDTMSKFYSTERKIEVERQHRKESLSGMMFKYQLINSENSLDKKQLIENIIDNYYVDIEKEPIINQDWKLFLLTKIDVRKMDRQHEETSNNQSIVSFTPQLDEKSKEYQQLILKDIDDRSRYVQLKIWAHYKLKNDEKFKENDIYSLNIPLVILSIKEILELHEDEKYNYLYTEEIPAICSCILLRDFNESLTEAERIFCKDLFLKHIFNTSDNRTDIEYYINVLPSLINIFPEDKNDIKFKFLELLRLGYGIVAMMKMWDKFYEDIYSILIAYLVLEPLYDKKYDEYRKKRYENEFRENFSRTSIWNEILKENREILKMMNSNELSIKYISDFNSIDIDILSKAFNILPDEMNTQETQDLSFALSSVIANKILSNKDDKINFQTKENFCLKLSYIMLNSKTNKIDIYLVPFLQSFNSSEIIATLFNELIKAEDSLNKYNNFWYIWKSFQSSVIDLCKNGDRFSFIDKIVLSYLFSSHNILGDGIFPDSWKSWHSLQPKDKRFFKEMSENIGHCPSALYSMSKFLTSIGSIYLNDGIAWIANMLRKNINLSKDKLEDDTTYYIKILIRKYIFESSQQIKREKKIKEDVLEILNFLIEKGSALGYMLREKIM